MYMIGHVSIPRVCAKGAALVYTVSLYNSPTLVQCIPVEVLVALTPFLERRAVHCLLVHRRSTSSAF